MQEHVTLLHALAVTTDKNSAFFKHLASTGHSLDFDSIKIIDRADSDRKLCWKEMLHIRQSKPTFNKQEESNLNKRALIFSFENEFK